MSYGRGSGGYGPRSTRRALASTHRGAAKRGGKPPRKTGCPLWLVLLLPLLPVLLPLALRRRTKPPEWPPADSRQPTARPRRAQLDLADAADHYRREARHARRRAGGWQLGDPVRRRSDRGSGHVRTFVSVAVLVGAASAAVWLALTIADSAGWW